MLPLYVISMGNSAKSAVRIFLAEVEKGSLVADSTLKYAATLKKYLTTNRIDELEKYFKSPRGNASISSYIEQTIELLNAAEHYFSETDKFDKARDCNELTIELNNLLKHFLSRQHTFFDDSNLKTEPVVMENESYEIRKQAVFKLL